MYHIDARKLHLMTSSEKERLLVQLLMQTCNEKVQIEKSWDMIIEEEKNKYKDAANKIEKTLLKQIDELTYKIKVIEDYEHKYFEILANQEKTS